eukprot:c27696_g1_i1.p1 GENE.c27696_g1_i1~~c27696_g1_i1.p1  ORF type:complete len:415 (+),score=59.29 c27696_g1_i1:34-1245(+)
MFRCQSLLRGGVLRQTPCAAWRPSLIQLHHRPFCLPSASPKPEPAPTTQAVVNSPSPKIPENPQFSIKEWVKTTRGYNFFHFFLKRTWFRNLLIAARVLVLGFVVYKTGYDMGVMLYLQDPEENHQTLVRSTVKSFGGSAVFHPSTQTYARVQIVADKILDAAVVECQEQLKLFNGETKADEKMRELYKGALHRIRGHWQFIVIHSKYPNACVTGVLPRHLFVTSGLLELVGDSDDELAMVIGHEVSHLMFDHGIRRQNRNLNFVFFQMAVVSLIDPLGIMGLGIATLIANRVSELTQASFSRQDETDADLMGHRLMARACYRPVRASSILKKLASLQKDSHYSWTDTHPAGESRTLLAISSAPELREKFEPHCVGQTKTLVAGMLGKLDSFFAPTARLKADE